jgi:hypothetical protein
MKRLPRKRYEQLVRQYYKGVDAFEDLRCMVHEHASDQACRAWSFQPDMNDPYRFKGTLDEELDHAENLEDHQSEAALRRIEGLSRYQLALIAHRLRSTCDMVLDEHGGEI